MGTNSVKMNSDYSGGQVQATRRYADAIRDAEVFDLFQEYTVFPTRAPYWEFRRKVITAAQRLFGGNYNWFLLQDNNASRSDYNYEFLLDTVRFIATGQRRMSIHTWPMLVSDEPAAGLALVNNRKDIARLFQQLYLNTSAEGMIQKWMSQPKGFDDMMFTLHLLFGKTSVRIK